MLVLPMTALRWDQEPPVLLRPLDDVADLHAVAPRQQPAPLAPSRHSTCTHWEVLCAVRRGSWLGHAVTPATRRGLLEGLRGLPWVLRKRRPVPPRLERGLRLLEA